MPDIEHQLQSAIQEVGENIYRLKARDLDEVKAISAHLIKILSTYNSITDDEWSMTISPIRFDTERMATSFSVDLILESQKGMGNHAPFHDLRIWIAKEHISVGDKRIERAYDLDTALAEIDRIVVKTTVPLVRTVSIKDL